MARSISNTVYLASPQKGVDGRTTLAGERAPVITDGRIGDFWIDTRTDEQRLYGPKNAAGWPDLGLIKGNRGWTPVFGVVTDGSRRVQQVIDWQGGEGTKPAIGKYVGPTGLVDTAAAAVDIRGPEGPEMIIDGLTPAVADISDATQLPVADAGDDNEKRTVVEVFDLGAVLDRRSVAHAQASNVRAAISRIRIGQLVYERVNAQPNIEGKFRTLDRWTADGDSDSANGGWWRLATGESRDFVLTLTVGPSGDYPTLNDALRAASVLGAPRFKGGGVSTEIKLLSGFVMAEQVIVNGVDLGYIKITSEAAEVSVTFSALVTDVPDMDGANWRPVFSANNGVLPTIGCKFRVSAGSGGIANGILLINGARATVLPGCGVEDAPGRGAMLQGGAHLIANGATFRNSTRHNLFVENGSKVTGAQMNLDRDVANVGAFGNVFIFENSFAELRGSTIQNANASAVEVRDASVAVLRECNMSGATLRGLWVYRASNVDAKACIIENVGERALYTQHGGLIDATECQITNSGGYAIYAQFGSKIIAELADITTTGATAVYAETGSEIDITGAVLSLASNITAVYAEKGGRVSATGISAINCDIGVRTAHGGYISAAGSTLTGCTTAGAQASGGELHISGSNCRKSVGVDGSSDIRAFNGAIINSVGATGGKNVAVNTVSSSGVIFA